METKDKSDYQDYSKIGNRAKSEIRKAKREFEREIARQTKSKPKAFFKYANSKLKTHSGIADLTREDGSTTEGDQEKAEVLNDFFASVYTHEDMSNMPSFENEKIIENMEDFTIQESDVLNQLKVLNSSKAQGPDKIHPRLLKEASKELAGPLSILFNRSLKERKVPNDWKEGQVSPICKKGSRSSPSNYRPVSLTSIICKIMETLIRKIIPKHHYLNANTALSVVDRASLSYLTV